jgi:CubicO group peptidase (beta-lactamase class C family)
MIMKRRYFTMTVMLSLIFAFVTSDMAAQSLTPKQLTAEYDKMLSDQFKAGETGCAALVAMNGQVIYRKAFGMADLELNVPMQPEMVFRIGSITKQFTAIAILQLMEQGKLSLQDEITRFIPDYPMQGHSITVEHLLTHTSGIKSYTNVPEFQKFIRTDMKSEEVIDLIKSKPMEFAPGTKWNYNNSGYFLLGYIIEKVSGKTYQEYLQENFFSPLGMTSSCYGNDTEIIKWRASGYQPGKEGAVNSDFMSMLLPYAAGSIMSTVDDLYKWNRAVHSYKLVKKETLDMAHTAYKLKDGKSTGYGYGWSLSELQGNPTIEHGGGINGYLTSSVYLPDEDVFVALFSNSNGKAPEFSSLKMAALAIGKPLKTTEMQLNEAALKEYQGIYVSEENKEAKIVMEEGKLAAARSGGSRRTMIPVEKDMFLIENSFTSLKFSRDPAGKIIMATFDDRGDVTEWKKSDKSLEEKKVVAVDEAKLDKYVGEYEIQPGFSIAFTREGARLFTQATGQPKFEIFAETESKFFLKVVDAQVEFVAGDDGKFNKIILYRGGQQIEGKRVR